MEDYLYKYTTLETLALILKSRKIRLNPLSKMDDYQEAQTNDFINFSKFAFVSSWINQAKESIAMWKLYSNLYNGVRIGLKRNPFKKYHISRSELEQKLPIEKIIGDGIDLILPFEECFGENYLLQNYVYKNVLKKVIYTDKEEELLPQIFKTTNNGFELAYEKLGIHKNTYWEFQNEERYILRYFPFGIKKMIALGDRVADYAFNSLKENKQFFPYKELEIDNEAFSNMQITVAPNFTEGNMIILNALKDCYNHSLIIEESKLTNCIVS